AERAAGPAHYHALPVATCDHHGAADHAPDHDVHYGYRAAIDLGAAVDHHAVDHAGSDDDHHRQAVGDFTRRWPSSQRVGRTSVVPAVRRGPLPSPPPPAGEGVKCLTVHRRHVRTIE